MSSLALFERFPGLGASLPRLALGAFPTPVTPLLGLGDALGADQLYMKRDDSSGEAYGGNKVRKLEFLLAEALRRNAKAVITFGCVGSNHALATAIYAKRLGLKCVSMLLPQPNAHSVRRNLLRGHNAGAELHYYKNAGRLGAGLACQYLHHALKAKKRPYVIPAGGSCPVGVVGFVNAAFELADQVAAGQLPEPDVLYVAAGTTGTAVGLMLGLKAAGLKTRVAAVRVTPEMLVNPRRMLKLLRGTNALLRKHDPSFPAVAFTEETIAASILHGFFGQEYALYTEEAMQAVDLIEQTEGITLEGTYTGKACAALIAHVRRRGDPDEVVLFWNTYSSTDFPSEIAQADYHDLPPTLHRWFEQEVQPLDGPP